MNKNYYVYAGGYPLLNTSFLTLMFEVFPTL